MSTLAYMWCFYGYGDHLIRVSSTVSPVSHKSLLSPVYFVLRPFISTVSKHGLPQAVMVSSMALFSVSCRDLLQKWMKAHGSLLVTSFSYCSERVDGFINPFIRL